MAGPLDGVRVLEVAGYITGPYAGQTLADLGADVIKVEQPPRGDPFRGADLYKPGFVAQNRGKRSLSLNLKSARGRDILHQLVAVTDVVLQNMRPGVAERLGFGYERLRELKPDIIYCSISGFGATGPYAQRPSYNDVGQGLSGLLSLITDRDKPRPIGPGFSDTITGVFAAQGILAALYAREKTGQGQHVELSMLEATLGILNGPYAQYFANGEVEDAYDRPHTSQAYAFNCSDGLPLVFHLSSPTKFWEGLVTALGRADLISNPRYATKPSRIKLYDEIQAELEPIFATKPRAEWLRILEDADIPVAPLYRVDEVPDDPQAQHLGVVQTAEHPTRGSMRLLRFPARLSGTPTPPPTAPPVLGEHTDEILATLGYSAEDIQQLRAEDSI